MRGRASRENRIGQPQVWREYRERGAFAAGRDAHKIRVTRATPIHNATNIISSSSPNNVRTISDNIY